MIAAETLAASLEDGDLGADAYRVDATIDGEDVAVSLARVERG
jgi:hypothetical protein